MERSALVKGAFPGPKTQKILQELKKYESRGEIYFNNYEIPPVISEAKGVYVKDVDGNVYLDLTSGFAALNVGHCHPKLIEAAINQMKKVHHTAMLPVEDRAKLVEKLSQIAPGSLKGNCKVQLDVSGTNAIEIAIKLAKLYTKRPIIISFYGAYHGRSFGTLAVTSDAFWRAGVYPIMPGGVQVPYPYCYRCYFGLEYPNCELRCLKFLERILTDPKCGLRNEKRDTNLVAAILMEPSQGASGYVIPPDEFWPGIRELCDKYDILLIDDEIQMGWGRSGKMFAIENWGVTPDIMVVGKSMSGGVIPVAATIARTEIMDVFQPNHQSVTFGGTPVACAVSSTMIDLLEEEKLADRAEKLGKYFLEELKNLQTYHPLIGHVEGKGLMIGMEFVRDRKTKEPASNETKMIIREAIKRGLILTISGYYGNRINIVAPLIIEKDEIDKAIEILDETINVAEKKIFKGG